MKRQVSDEDGRSDVPRELDEKDGKDSPSGESQARGRLILVEDVIFTGIEALLQGFFFPL